MPDTPFPSQEAVAVLDALLSRARKAGADQSDALALSSRSLAVGYRLGEPEQAERSESTVFGLRVLIGGRQAAISTADTRPAALDEAADRAVAMAKAAPVDPSAGLADRVQLAGDTDAAHLELHDPAELDEDALKDLAKRAEDAALSVAGITNSGGASAGASHGWMALVTSTGFQGSYAGSEFSLGVSVLAGSDGGMERDYATSSTRFAAALEASEAVGRRAGERAVARLQSSQPPTGRMPVVFHPRVANSLLSHFAQAVNGANIARGTSFLKDRMGESVFADGISIVDDSLRPRGMRSRPFDAEGLLSQRLELVREGRLQSWLLDCASARKLGLESTGSAGRGISSPPSPGPTNLYMVPGVVTPDELLETIGDGIYVTELIGMGVNPVTGDYSRGAAGFLIEGGVLGRPISEFTLAGNLKSMFASLTPASDLEFRYGVNAPTIAIPDMTIAGA